MKKASLSIFIFLFANFFAAAQPLVKWQKSFGGSKQEGCNALIQTLDSGYIMVGFTASCNGNIAFNHDTSGNTTDFWIVRYDSSFVIQWERTFGGTKWDEARSVVETYDGGFAIAGLTNSNDGDVLFNHDTLHSNSDIWLIKLSSNGAILWQKSLGGTKADGPSKIIQGADSSLFIVGQTYSYDGDIASNHDSIFNTSDVVLFKLDSLGNLLWEKTYGGSGPNPGESGSDLMQLADGKLLMTATALSPNGDLANSGWHSPNQPDFWILKLDSAGGIIADTCFGGTGEETPTSLLKLNDSTFVITGVTNSHDGNVTGYLGNPSTMPYSLWSIEVSFKGDSSFSLNWNKCVGNVEQTYIPFAGMLNKMNGNLVFVGTVIGLNTGSHGFYDFWGIEMDTLRNVIWSKAFGGSQSDMAKSVLMNTRGNYILAGSSSSSDGNVSHNNGMDDVWITEIEVIHTGLPSIMSPDYFSVFPNPAKDAVTIRLKNNSLTSESKATLTLTDITGRVLLKQMVSPTCQQDFQLHFPGISPGIYLLQVLSGEDSHTIKLVVEQ